MVEPNSAPAGKLAMDNSDTWKDIQALKSRQSSFREKLLKRKKEREEIVLGKKKGFRTSIWNRT